MPGQRGISARRSRGSWAVRIAGIALAVFAAATVASVLVLTQGTARAKRHPHAPPPPPRNVVSALTVALVNPGPRPRPDSHPVPEMLQESATGLAFTATGGAGQASGQDWTADQMSGGTYIFIYVPDGRCLTAPASLSATTVTLARCNLGLGQRWRHQFFGTDAAGRDDWQLRSAVDGLCLTAVAPALGSQPGESGVALRGCSSPVGWRQIVSLMTMY
jgi:hypothetical protein